MKIWIDDVRPAPEGYNWYKSVNSAIRAILNCEKQVNNCMARGKKCFESHDYSGRTACYKHAEKWEIEVIDMDHDAGDYAKDGGDYIKLLDWLEETGRNYPIKIHSMNPVGVENMRRIIEKNGWGV